MTKRARRQYFRRMESLRNDERATVRVTESEFGGLTVCIESEDGTCGVRFPISHAEYDELVRHELEGRDQ